MISKIVACADKQNKKLVEHHKNTVRV